MNYTVVIEQDDEQARLDCETYEEAVRVKVSFENYGKCQSIEIETKDNG